MSFWREKTVFVTGASGLMGGWLSKALLDQGAHVVALIRDQSPRSMIVREGIITQMGVVTGELEDLPLMQRAMAEYEPFAVFHLAAQPLVGVAKKDPVGTLRANVMGTWNLLEACRQTSVQNVVVASSDKAYGENPELPYKETHALAGTYPYDVSKSCTDLISRMYAVTYGMNVAIARCGNLFGGGDLNFGRLLPGVILSTLKNERFIIRSDGNFVRDYLFVKDAAECYMLLGQKLAEDPGIAGEAFNFSFEVRLTVLEIVRIALAIMGRPDLDPKVLDTASSEIREQYLDASKARLVLGWKPRFTMEEAIRQTVDWYRLHLPAFLGSGAEETVFSFSQGRE